VIKRIEFADGGDGGFGLGAGGARARARVRAGEPEVAADGRPVGWQRRADAALDAPDDVRPLRVTWCTVQADVFGDPRHDGLGLEWYADEAHLERFDTWLRSAGAADDEAPDAFGGNAAVIVAAEHVMRGDEWLEGRWRRPGLAFKHVAVARRAAGLTPAQFSETWRTGAGRVQRAGDQLPLVIPADVRGCAYVQNHPLPSAEGNWTYDAVNEVSFEDLEGLRRRVAWFEANVGAGAEPHLISASWFLATAEVVVLPGR
jgi:hypothetical protein